MCLQFAEWKSTFIDHRERKADQISTRTKLVQKSTLKQKKKILVQQGGFLEYLIPAAISGITSIISSFINKE